MDKEEILEFIRKNDVCYMATVDGDTPHVRGMGVKMADENGILLQSWTFKDLYPQLCHNPKVELCFHDRKKVIQVRVSGKIESVEDVDLKQKIVTRHLYLGKMLKDLGKGYEVLYLFILRHGLATVWTRENNFMPKEYVQL